MKTMSEDLRYRSAIDASLQEMHTSLGEIAMADDSNIASFYTGKSVFITGATGFMGKVLVEKLLRSCSGVKSIYVLLRSKKGVEPRIRLNELLNSKIFDRVRSNDPSQLSKVMVIPGDITMPALGISNADIEILTQDVSIVFHSAATVKFDEPMRTSINFNTLGTRHILDLCRKMKKLTALVHVSTAYSNCDRHEVEEKFYPPPAPPQKIIEMSDWMDDDTLATITPKLLGSRPNTYTYTKALAESLLAEESQSIPVAIVRPSIVTAAWREPYPGWVDNINGPTGMVLASGKGLLRTMLFDSHACADIIPVDMVINLMITVAWHTSIHHSNQIRIYNCTSGTLNSIKWGDIERIVFPLLLRYPSVQVFRYPGGNFTESRLYNQLCSIVDHLIPAYIFDGAMRVVGSKPIMVRIYQKLHRATAALEWFTTRDWHFQSTNVMKLSQELKGIDQKLFHFDVRNLQWQSYWEDYIVGIRKFILKEENSSLPHARNKLTRMYYTQKLFYILVCFVLWHMFLLRAPFVRRLWAGSVSWAIHLASGLIQSVWPEWWAPQLALLAQASAVPGSFNSTLTTASGVTSGSSASSVSSVSSALLAAIAAIAGFPTSSLTST